ncbi:BRO family protein [Mesorhizobium sp. M0187]|uniref:BRO family protein n=1 Tax=Mesorhizobium sp. M0187 TaxID=2956908 RepID=UPI00333AC41D
METAIEELPAYRSTIDRLEKFRQEGSNGQEYWMARDIHPVLGYRVWDKFEPVIERAASSFTANTIDPSHHIARASKMMELGGGGKREGLDYFLSRAACRLIAMNGDPSKAEIAAAQAYFVVQTHRMEAEDALTQDEKRLNLRDKVTTAFRTVSGVAKEAGVPNSKQALFHDARYQGLYDMPRRDVMARKGLKREDNPFDYAGPLELSANEFQMNMAADVIKKEGIKGEYRVIDRNKKIAQDVRKVMRENGSTMPENLPVAEPIRVVEKRVKAARKLEIKS